MPLTVSLFLTACFVVCGAWAIAGLSRPRVSRTIYVTHAVMAGSMLLMVWGAPTRVAGVAAACTGLAAVVTAARGWRRPLTRMMSLHHAGMLTLMALMWVAMGSVQTHADGAMVGHQHVHGGAGPPPLTALDSVLLLAAIASLAAAVLWWQTADRDRREGRDAGRCQREGGLEGLASLGMALGAAAMVVAH